jgi:hypothetical protein
MIDHTVATTIATIFLTKALEGSGEELGKLLLSKVSQSISKIFQYSPKIAIALQSGDSQVLNLDEEVLAQIPPDPIFAEFLAAADVEQNAAFQKRLSDVKAGRILQVMANDIEGASLKAKSMKQTAPSGRDSVRQTMLRNVKVTGDIDLGDLSQG